MHDAVSSVVWWIDMQIALGLDLEVDQRMPRELLEHVVQEADAGFDVVAAGAVEIDGSQGFRGLAASFALDAARCRFDWLWRGFCMVVQS